MLRAAIRERGQRVLRRSGIAALILLVLSGGIYVASEWQLDRRVELPAEHTSEALPPSRPADIGRGETLARLALCITCHGEGLSGVLQAESPLLGRLYSSNLTSGAGGVGSAYEYVDWERAIRHGIGRDGRPLLLMPSHTSNGMSDADLADLVAFLRALPAVDHQPAPTRVGPMLRLGIGLGLAHHTVSSWQIDHTAPHPTDMPVREGPSYGEYLVGMAGCRACHGMALQGSPRPMELLGGPPPPSLLEADGAPSWSDEVFVHTMRTGVLPGGGTLDARFMPSPSYAALTDLQLRSIRRYLAQQSSPVGPGS